MRSTIYLSLVLSLWSLFVSSLPLRSCLHPEPLDKDDVAPCTPIQPGTHDLPLGEGSPHRKARATDVLADTNTLSALKSRVALVKRATVNAEEFLRRNVESLFLKVGKGGNIADSRAGRSLKERWSISQGEWLDLTSYGLYLLSQTAQC
ncbi:hypothetical protein BDR22DRAFT_92657 [Usnea florida]